MNQPTQFQKMRANLRKRAEIARAAEVRARALATLYRNSEPAPLQRPPTGFKWE